MSQRRSGLQRLIDRLLQIRSDEVSLVAGSFFYFFFLLSSYFCLRPLREAISVATGVENLQFLFSGTFVAMLIIMPVFGWLVARFPKRIFLPAVYLFFLSNLLGFQWLLGGENPPQWAGWAYFVWLSVFNLFVVSVFWSLMADLFSSTQGKRLFGVIASGGSLGAIIGPLLTALWIEDLGRGGILLLAAVLLTCALACLFWLIRHLPGSKDKDGSQKVIGGSILAGVSLVFQNRFLGGIAAIILLTTLLQSLMYFHQIDLVGRHYGDNDPTRFFALVDAATSVISIGLQFFITGRLLQHIGVARTLAIMPLITAVGFLLLAVAPGIVMIGVVQAIRRGGEYGLMKPARDLLFTRVDDESKYKSKNFIDTVVYRGGDVASGWSYRGLNGGLRLPAELISAIAVPISLVWAWLAYRMGQEFDQRDDV